MTAAIYYANSTFTRELASTAPRVAEWGPENLALEYGVPTRVRTLSSLSAGAQVEHVRPKNVGSGVHRTKKRESSKNSYGAIRGGALFGLFIVLCSFLFSGNDSDPYLSSEMPAYSQSFDTSIR